MDLSKSESQVPWVVIEAKDWLDSYLKKNMTVLEWGSGSSTIYYAKKVKKVITIEHEKEWFKKVTKELKDNHLQNCSYFFVKPEENFWARFLPYSTITNVCRTLEEYKKVSFGRYVKKIDQFENHSFDLVVVDGRARTSCMTHAIKKIKKSGYLMLDNSERKLYESVISKLNKKYEYKIFFGHGPSTHPCSHKQWQTTVWKIK